MSCRPISTPGSSSTMNSDRIRALVLRQDADADLHCHIADGEGEIDAGCVTPTATTHD